MKSRHIPSITALRLSLCAMVAVGTLSACATQAPGEPRPDQSYSSAPAASATYGRIESIEIVRGSSNPSGAGAIVGGLVGGLLGNQVGGGTGRTAATVAGAVGGAVAGNQIEKNKQAGDAYQIGVRLDNGGFVSIVQDSITDLRIGDRVSVQNKHVYRY